VGGGVRQYLLDRLPEAERHVGYRELRTERKPSSVQIEEQLLPGLRTLAHAVDQTDQLLLTLGRGADDDQQTLGGILEPGLHMDAVGPEVDVTLGGEIALAPARMLLQPGLLEPSDGRGRQPAGILAEQRDQRLVEVASGDALEVEDRDQHLEALRPACVGRQNRRREADALRAFVSAITYTWTAHRHRTNAGHDLALRQMPVPDQPLPAVLGQLVGMHAEQGCDLGLDGLRQQRSRAVAEHLGQRISKSSWLGQLENVSLGHGVSLLQWRSGGSNTPTIRRLTSLRRHQLSPIARRCPRWGRCC